MATTRAPLEITFDAHEYHLSEREERLLREKLDGLSRQVENFPVAEIRVYLQAVRSNEIVVKLTLLLPGTTLTVSDHDLTVSPAFDRCLNSLLHELRAYKDRLNRTEEATKLEQGTHHDVEPAVQVNLDELEEAVKAGDYTQFHRAMLPYEEDVRMRVGRWVQRYPSLNAAIGDKFEIADVVEDVLLLAFEDYEVRPLNVPFGHWLEKLIDVAVKDLLQHPDETLENISAIRTARDAVEGQEPS